MNIENVGKRVSLLIGIGFITGVVISAIDNYAFEGEVSPVVIVALLFLTSATFGAFFSRKGYLAAIPAWVCIPLVHIVKHLLNLPDTIYPNTYASIIKLAIFTFVVALIGFGIGILLNRFFKAAVKNN